MSLFHVFIERPRSAAPGAVPALARAISDRYGIPAADLEGRIASGRFRVKGNVDRATADTYAHDLARLGAVVTIISAEAAPATTTPPVSLPRVERAPPPTAPPAARVPEPPAPITASSVARAAAPPAPRAAPSSWPPPSDVAIPQDLGALSGEFPLTLSTLDGATEDEARASRKVKLPASFAPPEAESAAAASRKAPLPASFGPPPDEDERDDDSAEVDVGDDDQAAAALDVFDPFAPPEDQADAPELMLAVERKSRRISSAPPPARPSSSTTAAAAPPPPPPTAYAMAAPPALPAALATHATPLVPRTGAGSGWKGALRDEGIRLVAGAVLAVVIGGVPAILIGAARERAEFAEINTQLDKQQAEAARTRDAWDGLDRVRAGFAERKRAERQSIAITSLLIWAALGGGFTWLWFRKIDWDRALA